MGMKLVVVYCLHVTFMLAILISYPQAAAADHSAARPPALAHQLSASSSSLHTYLVHVPAKKKPSTFTSLRKWHVSLLAAVVGSAATAESRLLYSYEVVMQGFAALLSLEQLDKLAEIDVVEAAFEDTTAQVHTTRTPAFLGLAASSWRTGSNIEGPAWRAAKQGQNVIIGVLDGGIWPEHPSFSDHAGFSSPIPSRWKGTCESSPTFNSSLCNRKLIGARTFFRGFEAFFNETIQHKSPRDDIGHGTHTASTASGRSVPNASLSGGGAARGNASGMAPLSHIAMYKVCWLGGCISSDVLAGFEAAIVDGVDVISASIGGEPGIPFFKDAIAIGAFAAVARGIITSCSAGNSGPKQSSISNEAPWIFSIAASSIDRDFPASVVLGNGERYKGASFWYIAGEEKKQKQLPLVYAADAVVPGGNASIARKCLNPELLATHAVKGKIVLCDHDVFRSSQKATGSTMKRVGAAGMILGNNFMELGEDITILQNQVLPATLVGYSEARKIKQYINSTAGNRPTAHLEFQGTRVGIKPAPIMAAFSSRGPNSITPEILKPDVTAPGVNILAAWRPFDHATPNTKRQDHNFNIDSGTSMSCPHVAGITALLKAVYPTWSPAAIRSALMTTATTIDNSGKTITDGATGAAADPTAYGSGHIHPTAAFDPGLVYDISTRDYIVFLCSLNYTEAEMSIFVGSYKCSKSSILRKSGDLNYPAFSVVYDENKSSSSIYNGTFTRTLTNVGPANSTYRVSVKRPSQVGVSVKPNELSFVGGKQKLSYSITFTASKRSTNTSAFGDVVWSDGSHRVYSPISFFWRT